MKITKRQLRRIIKEEKARLLREEYPARYPAGSNHTLSRDMGELIELVARAEDKATEIESKMQDVEYSQHAGGREAEDLQAALAAVWDAFGVDADI